ncbi:nucleobase:cation symporter-2 family protein [Crenobacter cavernae]|uniref:Purine permease n=1 Tax=Crenobacter cavernae TaxID=2290923 RepID=A0ABY0FIX3_9NEIS|nr:nucleobase:cation symporter-2 family protein [Crenobacter cavernae]RXZ45472.1 purine permease [Crenobacter cavernae]
MEESQAVHPVDEVLPIGQLFVYGLQHVLVMYAGAVAVPLILGTALNLPHDYLVFLINADLFACGIATIIQAVGLWKFGCRLPLVQGCTFAAVTPMILIGKDYGLTGIYGAVIASGIFTMLCSPFIAKLLRFFPKVVMGSIITLIGLSIMPVAVGWLGGGHPSMPGFGSMGALAIGLFTLLVVLLIYRLAHGFFKNIAILTGLVIGTVVASLFGMTDFNEVGRTAWLGVPIPMNFGVPEFYVVPCVILSLVMVVTMIETMSDMLAIGAMVEKPIDQETLKRGLLADGFSTVLGGVFNTFPYTAFAQNVGLIGVTGAKSRFIVAMAGVILIVLGLFPKLAGVVASVPKPVLGGAGVVMFGMVAVAGIRTLGEVEYRGNSNGMVVALALGIGMMPVLVPTVFSRFPELANIFLHSGITMGTLVAIVANLCLNKLQSNDEAMESATASEHA